MVCFLINHGLGVELNKFLLFVVDIGIVNIDEAMNVQRMHWLCMGGYLGNN